VKRDNLHFTLRFLGELGEDGARRVGDACARAAASHAPFELTLGGFGCFPPQGVPRVLWVGAAAGGEAFEALARDVERELRAAGFDRADHPFRAHLTIGRVRDRRPSGGSGRRDWRAVMQSAAPVPALPFKVEGVSVVQSQLHPKGSIYTVLRQARLGG
jgi:2'-5' RNA ligase